MKTSQKGFRKRNQISLVAFQLGLGKYKQILFKILKKIPFSERDCELWDVRRY